MKKSVIFIFIVLFILTQRCVYSKDQVQNSAKVQQIDPPSKIKALEIPKNKKKILILTSKGGGGHAAVSKALCGYLKDQYDISVINALQDILGSFDPMQYITFGKANGEDFYNFCLQCRWTSFINKFINMGCWGFRYHKDRMEQVIMNFLKKEKPDLIISVIPIINFMILNVAQKLDIPFLVLTNDLDTTNYIHALNKPCYKKFYYTIAFDDESIRQKILPAQIPYKQVKVTGFPLRPEFFTPKNKNIIKKDFNIPNDKPLIMLLMGGAGSRASLRYVKALACTETPIHIIVCLGRNEKLRRHINRIILPKHITLSIIGFTDRIADLMAISNVLITKPGPGSVCEAIVSNLPMIIDQTNDPVCWEMMNIHFVKKYGFGDILQSFQDLQSILAKYIKDPNYISKIKQNMSGFKKVQFGRNIKVLIRQILKS